MDFKHALEKLGQSKDFKKWKKANSHIYFTHAFKIPQEMPNNEWHLGFYNTKNDKITTFMTNGETETRQEDEIFKKDEKAINEVDIKKIKITIEEALEKAKEFQQLNYPKDLSIKTITILQNIKPHGNVWNITYITQAFNTLNMKIDASTGKIIDHSHSSIFSFRKE